LEYVRPLGGIVRVPKIGAFGMNLKLGLRFTVTCRYCSVAAVSDDESVFGSVEVFDDMVESGGMAD
jgi:hypothetical protein